MNDIWSSGGEVELGSSSWKRLVSLKAFKICFVSSQKLKDVEPIIKIVELDGGDLVKDYSDEIERMLGSKMKSVKVSTPRLLQPKRVAQTRL